jgi:hypothetical protein|tara:strand:- start:1641 stop:1838 length:198 start_codon:yes stop_codon:yes gene_type:complete
MQDNNGFTQKELILMVLDNQKELASKIEQLHSRMNERPTRMELTGWLSVTVMILGVIVNSIMKGV